MRILAKLWVCIAVSILVVTAQAGDQVNLRVLLRYDDVSTNSNTNFEKALFSMLETSNRQVLIGVIPFAGKSVEENMSLNSSPNDTLGQEKTDLLRELSNKGVIEIAMHGYNHRRYEGKTDISGLPEEKQYDLLVQGKKFLERVVDKRIDFFIPSWNKYDLSTVSALERAGFKVLSASVSSVVNRESNLSLLPGTTYPADLRDKIERALRRDVSDGLVVVTMHAYDFRESGYELPEFRKQFRDAKQITIEELRQDLEWIKKNPQVSLATFNEVAASDDLSSSRMEANSSWRKTVVTRHSLLPLSLKIHPEYRVYSPTEQALHSKNLQLFTASSVYIFVFFASAIAFFKSISHLARSIHALTTYILILLTALIFGVAYYGWANGFYMKAALVTTLLVGGLVGTITAKYTSRHNKLQH